MQGQIPDTVFGLLSLIVLVLAGLVARLNSQKDDLYKQLLGLQDQRVEESKETRDKIGIPLQQISQYVELTYRKLVDGGH